MGSTGPGIIYLVRHCSTPNDELNYPKLSGRRMGMALSDAGKRHATILAEYFASKSIDAIYASPLVRAVQTAHTISKFTGAPMTFCSSIMEADMGEWEGRTYDEILRNDVDRLDAYWRDPGTYGFPGGETLSRVCRRGLQFIDKLSKQHAHGRIVVVAHKYVNRAILAHFMSLPLHRAREIDQDPGCVNVIRVLNGSMGLEAVNFTNNFHLVDEEPEQCDSCSTTPAASA